MSVQQIQVVNDSIEDRLVFRIGTSANEEIRVFLTRRFLRDVWPHLTSMLAGHLATTQLVSVEADDEPAGFEHTFRDDHPTYPLGANPLLATEATLEATDPGMALLTLREGCERSCKLNLNPELLQALCAMLRAANEQAGWDLPLDYKPPASLARAPASLLLH